MRFAQLHNVMPAHEKNQKFRNKKGDVSAVLPELLQLVAGHRTFACICVYPRWPNIRRIGNDREGPQLLRHFRSQLERLPVRELAANNAHLHLATTGERLEDAIHVLHSWNAVCRSILVCNRPAVEHGPYWLSDQEFVLLGTKENNGFRCRTLHSTVDLDHSLFAGLPNSVRTRIEQASSGPFLEIFGTSPFPGWTVVGEGFVHDEDGLRAARQDRLRCCRAVSVF